MRDIDLAARVIVALNERQFGGGELALAMTRVAKRMSLTGELTPEVLRFAWSLCGELDLPAVLSPPPPPKWKRQNGKRETVVLELPCDREKEFNSRLERHKDRCAEDDEKENDGKKA